MSQHGACVHLFNQRERHHVQQQLLEPWQLWGRPEASNGGKVALHHTEWHNDSYHAKDECLPHARQDAGVQLHVWLKFVLVQPPGGMNVNTSPHAKAKAHSSQASEHTRVKNHLRASAGMYAGH